MKLILIILTVVQVTLASIRFSEAIPVSIKNEVQNQEKQSAPIIDEIFLACGPLFFPLGSAQLTDDDENCLLEIAMTMRRAANYSVVIDAHRDSSERKDFALVRAQKMRDYLMKHFQIENARFVLRDYGDTCPYETGEKNRNSRVEFMYWREGRAIGLIPKRCAPGAKPRFEIIK